MFVEEILAFEHGRAHYVSALGFPTAGFFKMPRISRVVVPGMPHHIVQRGSRRFDVFHDREDRKFYSAVFAKSCAMYGLRITSYSLMTNHVHHIAVPEHPNSIGETFHRAHGIYASWFNQKYQCVGHLWQERPFSCVLSENRLKNAIRYVENNPVRAGIVSCATDYPWSSARAHCFGYEDMLLDPDEPRAVPGWGEWLRDGENAKIDDLIRSCTFSGRPCGDEEFLTTIEEITGRSLRPKRRGPKTKVAEPVVAILDFID
jgi:putative transposase